MSGEIAELHVFFYGNVQGVFFRATTKKYAKQLGIVGTVQNLPDGSVELIAQGLKEDLETLIKKLEQEHHLHPEKPMKVNYRVPEKLFEKFRIVY